MTRQVVWVVSDKNNRESAYAVCTYSSDADYIVRETGSSVRSVPYLLESVEVEDGVLSLRIDLNKPAIMDTAFAAESPFEKSESGEQ